MEDMKNQALSTATKDSISIAPRDVLQRYDLLEAHLDNLKPGEYSVCINYKKKGVVELRRNPRPADHLNVLEKVTIEEYPVIEQIKNVMKEQGALNAMMSGSGPTVFGIYDSKEKARKAAAKIREKQLAKQVYVTGIHNARRK